MIFHVPLSWGGGSRGLAADLGALPGSRSTSKRCTTAAASWARAAWYRAAVCAVCSCGQLRAVVSGDPVRVSICHCLACQRRTGSSYGYQARFPAQSVTISGRSNDNNQRQQHVSHKPGQVHGANTAFATSPI